MNRYEAFELECQLAHQARAAGDLASAERHWSRAHILGQPRIGPHLRTHAALLGLYLHQSRFADAAGQLFRLVLVVPGTWLKRLPAGNTGLSNVSAFQPMAVPPDLAEFTHESADDTSRGVH